MFNKFMNWIVPKLEAWCERTGRTRRIYGKEDTEKEKVYLIRNILFKSPLFCIYIHRFMRSDLDRNVHDHPFGFVGYMVNGRYHETRMFGDAHLEDSKDPKYIRDVRFETATREQGSFAYRPATTKHLVKLDREYLPDERKQAPLTIILRGPYVREWGFWEEYKGFFPNSYRWVKWTEYLNETEADKKE